MNTTNMITTTKTIALSLGLLAYGLTNTMAANLAVVGNGAASGPIIVSSLGSDIALGTRVRIGTFNNVSSLNSTIADYRSGAVDYSQSLLNLSGNFTDLGTNVTNYGNANQTGTGVSSSQFVYNTTANLTVNSVLASHNVFNGSIANVNWSSSIGFSSPVYLWVAYNNEIGIFRDSAWTTPVSDLTALTLNLSAISNAQTGNTEVLLGSYTDYASGTDLLRLESVPEPSTGVLMAFGAVGLVAMRRFRKV